MITPRWMVRALLTGFAVTVAAAGQAISAPVITRPGSIQDSGPLGYWTEMEGQGRAGGFLLGKISLPEGIAVWQPIPISVLCDGKIAYTTGTDSKNQFAISSSHIPGALSLDGDAKRQMEAHFEGCVVQASLVGFTSSSITITHRNLRQDPELGTIMLAREAGTAATAVSATTANAKPEALKHLRKAHLDLLDKAPEAAERELSKAVEIDPSCAEAWYQLGRIQTGLHIGDPKASFEKAAAADPEFVAPLEMLLAGAVAGQRWTEAQKLSEDIQRLDATGTPQSWYFDALASLQLNKLDRARASAAKSIELDPLHTVPYAEQLLAVVLVQEKTYGEAAQHLRNCLTYITTGPKVEQIKKQLAQVEQLEAGGK